MHAVIWHIVRLSYNDIGSDMPGLTYTAYLLHNTTRISWIHCSVESWYELIIYRGLPHPVFSPQTSHMHLITLLTYISRCKGFSVLRSRHFCNITSNFTLFLAVIIFRITECSVYRILFFYCVTSKSRIMRVNYSTVLYTQEDTTNKNELSLCLWDNVFNIQHWLVSHRVQ